MSAQANKLENPTHNGFPPVVRGGLRVRSRVPGHKDNSVGRIRATGMDGIKSGNADKRSLTPFISYLTGKVFNDPCLSGLSDSVVLTVRTIVRSLLLVFLARKSLKDDWVEQKTLNRWIRASQDLLHRLCKFSSDDAILYTKYWLDHLMVELTHDKNIEPLPQQKFAEPLFTGALRRVIDRCLLKGDGRFILSLQRGAKLVWPRLSQVALCRSLDDHKKNICGKSVILGNPDKHFNIRDEIATTSLEILGRISSRDTMKLQPPSTSCYERSRRQGGVQFMHECIGGLPRMERKQLPGPNSPAPAAPYTVPVGIGLLPRIHSKLTIHRQRTHETAIRRLIQDNRLGDVKVMAIAEPAKFRILSEMRGDLVVALQPIQGAMLSKWKDHATSTMKHQDLTFKVSELKRNMPAGLKSRFKNWCSIDYKGATDTLPRAASYVALSGLPDSPWKQLAEASFIRGTAQYPKVTEGRGEDKKTLQETSLLFQNEGQLMGHLLSFPLLCIINLSCYRLAIRRWAEQGDWDERELRANWSLSLMNNVIVNGDDMLFLADDELYQIFDECRKEAGFVYSAGKNYYSEDWALINSQLFKNNKITTKSYVRRHHYFNQRLLSGSSLKSGDSEATPMDVARDLNEMVENVPWTKCSIPLAMTRWKDKFARYNWYIPVQLGGMGLNIKSAPEDWKPTRQQRLLASLLVRDPKLSLLKKLDKAMIPSILNHSFRCQNKELQGEYLKPEKEDKVNLEQLLKLAVPTVELTESEEIPDLPWLERLCMYAELNGYSGIKNSGQMESGWMAANFPNVSGVKPLSDREFQQYWRCGWKAASSVVPTQKLDPIKPTFTIENVKGADGVVVSFTVSPGRVAQMGL